MDAAQAAQTHHAPARVVWRDTSCCALKQKDCKYFNRTEDSRKAVREIIALVQASDGLSLAGIKQVASWGSEEEIQPLCLLSAKHAWHAQKRG
jgi:hypothetical protein